MLLALGAVAIVPIKAGYLHCDSAQSASLSMYRCTAICQPVQLAQANAHNYFVPLPEREGESDYGELLEQERESEKSRLKGLLGVLPVAVSD